MSELLLVALAGFVASIVDGALGMGFGPTSSTILLSSGLSPAAASTTVNVAKIATGVSAGVAHWRIGNVDRGLVVRLAVPGMAGALAGVTILANVDGDRLRPVLAVLLLLVGARILARFSRAVGTREDDGVGSAGHVRGVAAAAAAGGVTNGLVGAWGPVVTPYLLHHGVLPRLAVGAVNTAEVAVAIVASGSLLVSVGGGGIEVATLVAMLVGGVVASPLAARVTTYVSARSLGLAVATMLLLTNARQLADHADLGVARWLAYGVVVGAVTCAGYRPVLAARRELRRTDDRSPQRAELVD